MNQLIQKFNAGFQYRVILSHRNIGFIHQFMQTLLFLIFFLIALTSQLGYNDLSMTYKDFKVKFQKPQFTTQQNAKRQIIYNSNLQTLKTKLDAGCQYCGVTQFFDSNPHSFKSRTGLFPQLNSHLNQSIPQFASDSLTPQKAHQKGNLNKLSDFPTSLNWASKGKVTSIKNQGNCGTCWSFATVGAIQSSLILKGQATNNFFYEPDLSEEFVLTCNPYGSCSGGLIQDAIDLAYEKGIPYEFNVPYQAKKGDQSMCNNTKRNVKYTDGNISRYSFYNVGDMQIINMLQSGPVIVAVSADNWEYYAGGTLSCNVYSQVNHAVLLVGYDPDNWILKNQWGTNWGQKGYISVTRNPLYNCKIGSAVHQLSENSHIFSIFSLLISLILIH